MASRGYTAEEQRIRESNAHSLIAKRRRMLRKEAPPYMPIDSILRGRCEKKSVSETDKDNSTTAQVVNDQSLFNMLASHFARMSDKDRTY